MSSTPPSSWNTFARDNITDLGDLNDQEEVSSEDYPNDPRGRCTSGYKQASATHPFYVDPPGLSHCTIPLGLPTPIHAGYGATYPLSMYGAPLAFSSGHCASGYEQASATHPFYVDSSGSSHCTIPLGPPTPIHAGYGATYPLPMYGAPPAFSIGDEFFDNFVGLENPLGAQINTISSEYHSIPLNNVASRDTVFHISPHSTDSAASSMNSTTTTTTICGIMACDTTNAWRIHRENAARGEVPHQQAIAHSNHFSKWLVQKSKQWCQVQHQQSLDKGFHYEIPYSFVPGDAIEISFAQTLIQNLRKATPYLFTENIKGFINQILEKDTFYTTTTKNTIASREARVLTIYTVDKIILLNNPPKKATINHLARVKRLHLIMEYFYEKFPNDTSGEKIIEESMLHYVTYETPSAYENSESQGFDSRDKRRVYDLLTDLLLSLKDIYETSKK